MGFLFNSLDFCHLLKGSRIPASLIRKKSSASLKLTAKFFSGGWEMIRLVFYGMGTFTPIIMFSMENI